MDYEKLHKETLAALQQMVLEGKITEEIARGICADFVKGSEDERIRKAIAYAIGQSTHSDGTLINGVSSEEAIAWLEKQGKPQVGTGSEWVRTIDDACEHRYAEEYAHGEYCHQQSFRWGFQEGVDWLEKQGEQKSFDYENANIQQKDFAPKVEPKFKVGDWVLICDKTLCQIGKVTDLPGNHFQYWTTDGTWFGDGTNAHLWTIQDAKDGDVLANRYGSVFINAGFENDDKITLNNYCYVGVNGKFCIEEHKTGSWLYKDDIKPATKEQRDLLFAKMKEAGYEWDAEKKELKKIEQKNC